MADRPLTATDPIVDPTLAATLERAQAAIHAGAWAQAEQLCRDLLQAVPTTVEALQVLAHIAVNTGRPEEGAELLSRALSLRPQDANLCLDFGNLHYSQCRLADAVEYFDQAIARAPNSPEAHDRRAMAIAELGLVDEALLEFDRAIALAPARARTYHNRGITLLRFRRWVDAIASFDQALALAPNSRETYNGRGNALMAVERHAEALASFGRAIEVDASYAEAYKNQGNACAALQRPAEALASYDHAIALKPNYAEVFNNRATVLALLGRLDVALADYDQAIALQPNFIEAYRSSAAILQRLHRFDEARTRYARLVALDPRDAAAHDQYANVLVQLACVDDALTSYQQALTIDPQRVDSWNNQGVVLARLGRFAEALESYDHALALRPNFAEACANRGNALTELKRFDEALASYAQAIAVAPHYAGAHKNRGVLLTRMDRHEDALASFAAAIAIEPQDGDHHAQFGSALLHLERFDQALEKFDQALALGANSPPLYNSRGIALAGLRRFDEALASYDEAIRIDPSYAEAHHNRGVTLHSTVQVAAALESFERAIALDPEYASARWNQAWCRLRLGDYAAGWPLYEWRWQTPSQLDKRRDFMAPMWSGSESLVGRTILLHAEQGLGDTLQFCRYVSLVAARGAKVIFEVQPSLLALLAALPGATQVVPQGAVLPAFDYHCPLLSLPLAFRSELHNLPATVPYIEVQEPRLRAWRARLGPRTRPRIGLVWRGNALHANDNHRSLALAELLPLLGTWAEWFTIQKELPSAERELLATHAEIRQLETELSDFADSAALVSELDLIISVDTSVAHLAGALGRPLWLLLPFSAEWRWLLERNDSPWYPSARLFRQPAAQDWASVLRAVDAALRAQFSVPTSTPTVFGNATNANDATLGDAAAWFNRGNQCFRLGQRGLAVAHYARALEIDPNHIEARENRALALAELRRYDEAFAGYRDLIERAPLRATAYNNQGVAFAACRRFAEAVSSYDRAIQLRNDYVEAFNNRANALTELGQYELALAGYATALTLRPNYADAHSNRGNALTGLKRFDEALASYEQALKLKPGSVDALTNRGLALAGLRRFEHALASYDQALRIQPNFAHAHCNRGAVLRDLKRHEEALTSYDRAIALQPEFVEAYSGRSCSLAGLGRYEDAVTDCDRALALRPGYAAAWTNRGMALHELARYAEAVECYEHALVQDPDLALAHFNRGGALLELKDANRALASFDRAIALQDDFVDAYNGRGGALVKLGRFEDALADCDRALELRPDFASAWTNRGMILHELADFSSAAAAHERALTVVPDHAAARLNLALWRLLDGDYAGGWPGYEWRWQIEPTARQRRQLAQPLWLGDEAVEGKRILLHAEQGLGDTLQFCRYAAVVAARGAIVTLEVQPSLLPLLQGLAGVTHLIAAGTPAGEIDCHCPLLSLPLACRTELATVPAHVPYLRSDPQRAVQWRARLGASTRPRVGLVWSGNAAHGRDRQRSVPITDLLPILRADIDWVSLHKEMRPQDVTVLTQRADIRNYAADLVDFAETAALIQQLDLVITVDTSVAHLAGALGKPVWVLLSHVPDWRWLRERSDSPWYPSARLFRQPVPGDWASVITQLQTELGRVFNG